MFSNLHIILVETRFPENIGSIARASANFGNCPLHLVQPERWEKEKALPLATKQGSNLLNTISIHESLAQAVAKTSFCVGTTARTGGHRREILSPRECAKEIVAHLQQGEEVSLMFGPEDRGLENTHLEYCQRLVCIPTSKESSSLNIAHAALVLLYECFTAAPKHKEEKNIHNKSSILEEKTTPKRTEKKKDKGAISRRISNEERALLHAKLKKTLVELDVIQAQNPNYFFLSMARFLDKSDVRRHEMDMILGICRQIEYYKNKIF